MIRNLVLLCTIISLQSCFAQKVDLVPKNLAEQLGYDRNAKLLIMHADDLGVAHGVNTASIEAFEKGRISSASIMVPCPWFPELADYAKDHPELCWGIHLTLTAEWKHYKWDGVLSKSEIPSLLNDKGFMYDNVAEVIENANIVEIEKELRAQIERAQKFGIKLSHLDSHMGTLFATPELFKLYVTLGNEYDLPVMIPGPSIPPSWNLKEYKGDIHAPLDNLQMLGTFPTDWKVFYGEKLAQVKPGLNEIIVHLGYDNDEMKAIMIDHPDFGSAWRQKDLDYLLSEDYVQKLKEYEINLISYQDIQKLYFSKI